MKRKVIILFLVAAVAAVIAWRMGWGRAGDPNRLLLHGNIELTEIDLSFKVSGRLLELLVDEGDSVAAGQVIARLDRAELERTRERETATSLMSQSALTQLRTGIDYQRETIAGDIDLRRAELRQAEARLAELRNGSRPEEIQQAWAMEQEARSQNEQAQKDWERAQTLFKNEDITASQHDQYRTRAQAAAMALKRAQEAHSLVKEGARKEQIDAAAAQVDRARAAIKLSEANRIDLKRRQEEIPARVADIDRSKAQLAVLDTQLKDRTLTAPVSGVVLTKSAEAGEVLAAGGVVVTLGNVAKPWVRGYINERDLGRVKLGMPVDIRTDSFRDKVYPGKITFISSEAEFTPKTIQTTEERVKLVYRIKIEVDNPQGELKLNMPVDAEIHMTMDAETRLP